MTANAPAPNPTAQLLQYRSQLILHQTIAAVAKFGVATMSNRLSGKVCIITGTGGGMGREAALTIAREGALIVGCGLYVEEAEATVAAVGGTMLSMQPCDLTQPGDCKALVDFAVRTFGRVEVLFNNAALAHFNWLEDISDEEWDRNRRCEVDLVFHLTRAAWPYLKASRGVVVNTASLTALMSFKNGALAHTTAKAGIIGMTRQLAMEGREHGIRANSISPGVIETNQMREQLKDPEWAGYMLGKTPVGSPRPAGHSAHVLQHGIQICSRRLSPDAILP